MLLFSSDVVHGYLPDVSKTVVAGADLLIVEASACSEGELISFHHKMQGLRGRARIQKSALFKQLCHTLITPFDHDDLYKRDLYKHPHAAVVLCGQTAASLRSIVLKNG